MTNLRKIAKRNARKNAHDVCPECGGCISEGTHILGCKQREGQDRYYYKYSQREHCVFDRRAGVDWDCIKARCNDSESGKKFAELIVSALNQLENNNNTSQQEIKAIKCSICKDTGYMTLTFDGLSSRKLGLCMYCGP